MAVRLTRCTPPRTHAAQRYLQRSRATRLPWIPAFHCVKPVSSVKPVKSISCRHVANTHITHDHVRRGRAARTAGIHDDSSVGRSGGPSTRDEDEQPQQKCCTTAARRSRALNRAQPRGMHSCNTQ